MSEITVFLKQVFLGICGLSFGLLASAGVFTVLVSVGLIPRFAGKMHVVKKVFALEEAVVFGTLFGGFLSVFSSYGHLGGWILAREPFGESTVLVWKWIGSAVLILWGFFAGLSGIGHCGDAEFDPHLCAQNRLSAWAGRGNRRRRIREAFG